MSHKKRALVVASLLILIILLFAAILFLVQKKPDDINNSTSVPSDKSAFDSIKLNPIKILDNAVKEKNPSLCQDLPENESEYCISNVAMAANDMEICKTIRNQSLQSRCEGLFRLREISGGQDAKKCSELAEAELQRSCYIIIFRKLQDISLCLDLNGKARTDCQNFILNHESYKKNDEKLCNQITDDGLKKECLDNLKNKL